MESTKLQTKIVTETFREGESAVSFSYPAHLANLSVKGSQFLSCLFLPTSP